MCVRIYVVCTWHVRQSSGMTLPDTTISPHAPSTLHRDHLADVRIMIQSTASWQKGIIQMDGLLPRFQGAHACVCVCVRVHDCVVWCTNVCAHVCAYVFVCVHAFVWGVGCMCMCMQV